MWGITSGAADDRSEDKPATESTASKCSSVARARSRVCTDRYTELSTHRVEEAVEEGQGEEDVAWWRVLYGADEDEGAFGSVEELSRYAPSVATLVPVPICV